MKKSVFVIGLLIGIFLVGVVSAGTNVALISNNATSIATGNINLGISNDTHDGSMDNYVAGNPHNPLNDYFNGNYKILEDRNYWNNGFTPFDFHDVTEIIDMNIKK